MCGFSSHGERSEAGTSASRAHFLVEARKLGSIFLLCVGIWLVGGAGYFWPAWVLLFLAFRLGHLARHAYAPGGDPEPAEADATAVR